MELETAMVNYQTIATKEGCRVAVEGSLAGAVIPELQRALKVEVDNGARVITFDLQKTSMIDSSGIGLLIATFNTLARREGKISVINTAPEILKLLRSIRLVTRLNVSGRPGLES